MDNELLDKYCQFIRVVNERINAHFEDQKEYIHCKEGCALCCKKGEYPCSDLEFEFLKLGFAILDNSLKEIVINKILKLKAQKANHNGKDFMYECPFLINDRCSVYKYRMIICRSFGIPFYENENGKDSIKVPFCMNYGLNYSDVYDKNTGKFSSELFEKSGHKQEPLSYNVGLKFLLFKFGKEIMGLDFGEIKPLLDRL